MIARKKPESRPDVVAHDVQPEEAKQNADVDRVARDDAGKAFGGESFAFELHNRQADVQNGQTEDVAHQRLSMQVPQLGDEAVDAERNQQEGQRENHSWNGKKLRVFWCRKVLFAFLSRMLTRLGLHQIFALKCGKFLRIYALRVCQILRNG